MSNDTVKKLRAFDPDRDLAWDSLSAAPAVGAPMKHNAPGTPQPQQTAPSLLKTVTLKNSSSVSTNAPVNGGCTYIGTSNDRELYCAGNEKGELYFFEPAGEGIALRGRIILTGPITGTPLFHEGRLICATREGSVHAIETLFKDDSPGGISNRILWRKKLKRGILAEPVAVPGAVLVTTLGGIYGLAVNESSGRPAGTAVWGASISGTASTPCVHGNTIILGTEDRRLLAFDLSSGKLSSMWSAEIGGQCRSRPAVAAASGLAAAATVDGNICCVDAMTGAKRWSFNAGAAVSGNISAGAAGPAEYFIFCADNGILQAVATDGSRVWEYSTGAAPGHGLCIHNGLVYTGAGSDLVCIDAATGSELARFRAEGALRAAPLVHGAGIFFGTTSGMIYRLDT